jgi:hypothetical protein
MSGNATVTRPSPARTTVAGVAGGLAFVAGTFLTFGQLGGSRRGEKGLLFDPATTWDRLPPPRVNYR